MNKKGSSIILRIEFSEIEKIIKQHKEKGLDSIQIAVTSEDIKLYEKDFKIMFGMDYIYNSDNYISKEKFSGNIRPISILNKKVTDEEIKTLIFK